jgi:hypothetical protein
MTHTPLFPAKAGTQVFWTRNLTNSTNGLETPLTGEPVRVVREVRGQFLDQPSASERFRKSLGPRVRGGERGL